MPHNTPAERRLMRIEGQLRRLIGEGAAALFRDARRLADDGLGLEAQGTLVWHCAREIESAIRDALQLVAPIGQVAAGASQHGAEIASIVMELDLRESDAAIAWWKTRSLHGLAHRANLGPPRPFTRADWNTFLNVLELILGAFETRYTRMIETLDDLLAMTPTKAGKRTKKLVCHVPPTGQANALRHFFERADASWLRVLPDCILDDPPGREFAIDQPGYFQWPQWHASRYLAKVAPQESTRVFTRVMKVLALKPENPWTHIDFMTSPRTTGVWISANSATMLRWSPELTVRGRHRSTGQPRTEEHPGGEGHRDEHMRTFFVQVAHALSVDDDLLLVGDGEVVERFADHVRTDDENHGHKRRIEVEKSGPVTDRQLLARIRVFAGSPARRHLPR